MGPVVYLDVFVARSPPIQPPIRALALMRGPEQNCGKKPINWRKKTQTNWKTNIGGVGVGEPFKLQKRNLT